EYKGKGHTLGRGRSVCVCTRAFAWFSKGWH
ncbi:CYB5D1 isoform 5, partial [Pan troglodytes]